ncbi:MAG: DJ-1/PfpI family protein [Dehalococcoidia bacterium]
MTARNICFVLFPDFEELDFAGPWEVFGTAAKFVDKDWRVFSIAAAKNVTAFNRLTVQADYTFADTDAPTPDILIVPGGLGTRPGMDNQALVGYIRRTGQSAEYVTSVCTGAMLLHRAGFLRGRRAATHWAAKKELAELGDVTVVDERWVHEGNVITSAGVSAGIDMALYLVGVLTSPAEARKVQRIMEYDPAPPYAEVPV